MGLDTSCVSGVSGTDSSRLIDRSLCEDPAVGSSTHKDTTHTSAIATRGSKRLLMSQSHSSSGNSGGGHNNSSFMTDMADEDDDRFHVYMDSADGSSSREKSFQGSGSSSSSSGCTTRVPMSANKVSGVRGS